MAACVYFFPHRPVTLCEDGEGGSKAQLTFYPSNPTVISEERSTILFLSLVPSPFNLVEIPHKIQQIIEYYSHFHCYYSFVSNFALL